MSNTRLLAIDQGTTSSRAILFSHDGQIVGQPAQTELRQIYPQDGWVEQDPEDIWNDTYAMCRQLLSNTDLRNNPVVIGITNQRETTIVWDKQNGQPVYNAIVWQDRRTAAYCDALKDHGLQDTIAAKTGLRIDPYFSCSKIRWILDHIPNGQKRAEQGEFLFGTVDSFLLWRLTGHTQHATDATNASRTGLFNIITQQWDDELLDIYNIPRCMLPVVKDNVADFGMTHPDLFFRALPIGGMAGDQQAALIGQGCFQAGVMKSTYGTGCFALLNIGTEFQASDHNLLTTIAYRINGKTHYAIEGAIFNAGTAVQWLRDNLGLVAHAADTEVLAHSVPDNHGVYFIPSFTGLGAPYWKTDVRGAIMGLTRDSTKAHLVRAALEAQAYQTLDLLQAMKADTGLFPSLLRVDGGLVNNAFVCQYLADILQIPVERPPLTEITALGAAYLAGLSCGVCTADQPFASSQSSVVYTPKMDQATAQSYYAQWLTHIHRFLKD